MSSLVYLLIWSPPPHIPYISSPNQCILFATHAHTIATFFAVVSILSSIPSLSIKSLLGTLSFTKYADLESRYILEPIAVETLGVVNFSACLFLNEIGKRISVNTGESRETGFLF